MLHRFPRMHEPLERPPSRIPPEHHQAEDTCGGVRAVREGRGAVDHDDIGQHRADPRADGRSRRLLRRARGAVDRRWMVPGRRQRRCTEPPAITLCPLPDSRVGAAGLPNGTGLPSPPASPRAAHRGAPTRSDVLSWASQYPAFSCGPGTGVVGVTHHEDADEGAMATAPMPRTVHGTPANRQPLDAHEGARAASSTARNPASTAAGAPSAQKWT